MIQAHTNESLLQKCSRLLLCLEVKRFLKRFIFLCAFCVHEKGCKTFGLKTNAKANAQRLESKKAQGFKHCIF